MHTLLLGTGSFLALMVAGLITSAPHGRVMCIHCYLVLAHSSFDGGWTHNHSTTWQGDVHTLLLGTGSFLALMVAGLITSAPHGRVMCIHCYLVLAHSSFDGGWTHNHSTTWQGDAHTLLLGAGSF